MATIQDLATDVRSILVGSTDDKGMKRRTVREDVDIHDWRAELFHDTIPYDSWSTETADDVLSLLEDGNDVDYVRANAGQDNVDSYTYDLHMWLHYAKDSDDYMDEVLAEGFKHETFFELMEEAQERHIDAIANNLCDALERIATDEEEEEEEED